MLDRIQIRDGGVHAVEADAQLVQQLRRDDEGIAQGDALHLRPVVQRQVGGHVPRRGDLRGQVVVIAAVDGVPAGVVVDARSAPCSLFCGCGKIVISDAAGGVRQRHRFGAISALATGSKRLAGIWLLGKAAPVRGSLNALGCREIAGALGGRQRKSAGAQRRGADAQPFIGSEDEQLVLADGPAGGARRTGSG